MKSLARLGESEPSTFTPSTTVRSTAIGSTTSLLMWTTLGEPTDRTRRHTAIASVRGRAQGRHLPDRSDRWGRRARPVLVAPRRAADLGDDGSGGRAGAAWARWLEVRRGRRVRGAAVPLRAAARGVARADGEALRAPGPFHHVALPRRGHRDRR